MGKENHLDLHHKSMRLSKNSVQLNQSCGWFWKHEDTRKHVQDFSISFRLFQSFSTL